MPKARRYFEPGLHYHLTHRCHGRDFLLKFTCDRDRYRGMLRELSQSYRVPLLGYCITSNHVHLLVTAPDKCGVSLIDQGHLSDVTGIDSHSAKFQSKYISLIEEQLRAGRLHRQPCWSKTLAVGSKRFVEQVKGEIYGRQHLETNLIEDSYNSGWVLREVPPNYDA